MDYKEEYQNALERAKKGLPIDEVFPELKESEDERIRKELIEAIERARVFDIDKEVADRWISYLEKQKEPIPIPDKFSGLKSLMLQYLQSAANRKDDAEIESDTDLWGRKILDYIWKFDDKPVEWSEEDEKNIEKLDGFLSEVFCYGHVYISQKDKEELQTWLKFLRPQPHWKPSEEQIDALEWMLTTVSMKDGGRGVVLKNFVNDIKKQM